MGPAKVVFQDGKVVFIRHGGIFVRVSPNRLTKTYDSQIEAEVECHDSDSSDEHDETDKINMSENTETSVSETVATSSDSPDQDEKRERVRINPRQVKPNDIIKYKINDEWVTGTIMSRAGKSTGKYKTWYNVRDGNNEERSIDLGVVEWEKIPDTEINITSASEKVKSEEKDITIAKKNELHKLAEFNTYEEIAECGQRTSTRWVITNKEGKTKARLVVRGFEEKDLEIPRDSPTVGKGAMRIFLSIAGLEQWTVKTTDNKSAFLQGKGLEREIYVKPPKESSTPKHKIWKLKHGLYGLKDGARQFYESVKEELLKLGFTQCNLDPAVFYLQERKKLEGIICCHVDDFLHAGDLRFEKLMERLRARFSAGRVEEKAFKYIGFQIEQLPNSIVLDHSDYINNMKKVTLDPGRASQKNDL